MVTVSGIVAARESKHCWKAEQGAHSLTPLQHKVETATATNTHEDIGDTD